MRFWDSSALVPLLVTQPASPTVLPLIEEEPEVVLWWGTALECISAMARLRREGAITVEEESKVQTVLEELRETSLEMQPTENIRTLARRLLRTHPLRAADALQLAAALEWAGPPDGHVLVTFDDRLRTAARIEGFEVLPAG